MINFKIKNNSNSNQNKQDIFLCKQKDSNLNSTVPKALMSNAQTSSKVC